MNSVLQVHSGFKGIARVGDDFTNRRMAIIYNRWATGSPAHTHDLFDDGLTHGPHNFNLEMENDPRVVRLMEDLFEKTRAKGKTDASAETRRRYFEYTFDQRMKEVRRLLSSGFRPYDAGSLRPLTLTWMMDYAVQYNDRAIMPEDRRLYRPHRSGKLKLCNALRINHNCKGVTEPPKLQTTATKIEFCTSPTAPYPYVAFRWDNMDYYKACHLMGAFERKRWDWHRKDPGNMRRLFNRAMPKVNGWMIMDTPESLYGTKNNWFYIYAYWRPRHFSWDQVLLFDRMVSKYVLPKVGEFKPMEAKRA